MMPASAPAIKPPTVTRTIKMTTTNVIFSNVVFLRGPFSPNAKIHTSSY